MIDWPPGPVAVLTFDLTSPSTMPPPPHIPPHQLGDQTILLSATKELYCAQFCRFRGSPCGDRSLFWPKFLWLGVNIVNKILWLELNIVNKLNEYLHKPTRIGHAVTFLPLSSPSKNSSTNKYTLFSNVSSCTLQGQPHCNALHNFVQLHAAFKTYNLSSLFKKKEEF